MVIKYYATAGLNTESPYTETFLIIDPYMHIPSVPSYCVWIVPGTVDVDGNAINDWDMEAR